MSISANMFSRKNRGKVRVRSWTGKGEITVRIMDGIGWGVAQYQY